MKFALRQLLKNPGFTMVALATLALGIGVNTTAFTALNRLLLQPLPFRDPGSLVQIWVSTPRAGLVRPGAGDYFDERELNTVFEDVGAYVPGGNASLAEPGQPATQCNACRITASFFPLMGIQPELGRLFATEEDDRLESLTLVSHAFWRDHFASDPKILGRTVRLNSKAYTIVGVMPPKMDNPALFDGRMDFWPLENLRVNRNLRGGGWYHVAARLKPGVTLTQAQAEMDLLAQRLAKEYPKSNRDHGLRVIPFPTNAMGEQSVKLTWLVMALCGMVLLIACVNLANLQLVRTNRRSREIGIRLAMGCSSFQLMSLLLAESLILSVAGGALGLLAAEWSNIYVARFFGIPMPLDLRVVGFTFGIAGITGAMFGAVPAWMASRTDLTGTLRSSGRGMTSDRSRHWLRQGLVVAELGLALTLLAGAGYFIRGLYAATHQDLGWKPDRELIGIFELDHDHFGEERDPRSLAFSERMLAALQAMPGVEAAELSQDSSPAWFFQPASFRIEGQPAPEAGREVFAGSANVTPGFFDVYGISLLQGRNFRDSDRIGSPNVVIVNEAMARNFWPGENPIGKRIGGTDPAHPDWAEVVGVMGNFRAAWDVFNASTPPWKMLRPWAQNNHRFIAFNLRTAGDPAAYKTSVAKAMSLLAPDIAVSSMWTVRELMADETEYYTFVRRMLIQIAGLGLLLAAIGIYGVVANLASERTREIGIRMALGAQPGGVIWLFLKNGIQLAMVGALLGLVASYFLFLLLSRIVPDVPGKDPWVVGGMALILIAVALVASWLPARRTSRVNPMIALRSE
jgi:putative ABC transport system permease protein